MALVIRNENGYYIQRYPDGVITKTLDVTQAEDYVTLENAIIFCKCHGKRTKGYFVYDTVAQKICYRNCRKAKKNKRKKYLV